MQMTYLQFADPVRHLFSCAVFYYKYRSSAVSEKMVAAIFSVGRRIIIVSISYPDVHSRATESGSAISIFMPARKSCYG